MSITSGESFRPRLEDIIIRETMEWWGLSDFTQAKGCNGRSLIKTKNLEKFAVDDDSIEVAGGAWSKSSEPPRKFAKAGGLGHARVIQICPTDAGENFQRSTH